MTSSVGWSEGTAWGILFPVNNVRAGDRIILFYFYGELPGCEVLSKEHFH